MQYALAQVPVLSITLFPPLAASIEPERSGPSVKRLAVSFPMYIGLIES